MAGGGGALVSRLFIFPNRPFDWAVCVAPAAATTAGAAVAAGKGAGTGGRAMSGADETGTPAGTATMALAR